MHNVEAQHLKSFQSTLSVRRATGQLSRAAHPDPISIHALRKESDKSIPDAVQLDIISIHALRKESDWLRYGYYVQRFIFQSTLSVRRATLYKRAGRPELSISIHALRKESDRWSPVAPEQDAVFQSTLSVRRATHELAANTRADTISIHALRKESDCHVTRPLH